MAGAGSQQDWLVETEPETSVGIWELQKIQIRREYLERQNINKKKRLRIAGQCFDLKDQSHLFCHLLT